MSLALVIQQAMRMAPLATSYFPTLSHKRNEFCKKGYWI